jgi:hypothetical protein
LLLDNAQFVILFSEKSMVTSAQETGKEFRLIDFGFAQKNQEHVNSGLTPAFCSARVQVGFPASFDGDWESFLYVFA